MGRAGTMVLTAVLALVFGFVGALGAVSVFHDQLRGEQGATGLQGAPGEQGPAGMDGADGPPGPAGRNGRAGKAAKVQEPAPVDLGTGSCAGRPVQVVTDVTIAKQRLRLSKELVCVTR